MSAFLPLEFFRCPPPWPHGLKPSHAHPLVSSTTQPSQNPVMTSNPAISNEGTVPNAKRLLWAGFMAILAAGVGFALRGGIFGAWASEYGFTATQLGAIGGAGFTGFCFGIIIGGVIVDKLGYGKLVALALLGHVLSAVVTFMATKQNAYDFLYWGMFIFAYANGTLEAVANPLVATVFPHNRTHYLNIL
ncbi:MAG: MFS transporter, partial [Opitutaceae bacterium]